MREMEQVTWLINDIPRRWLDRSSDLGPLPEKAWL